jgi:hypothetical protein
MMYLQPPPASTLYIFPRQIQRQNKNITKPSEKFAVKDPGKQDYVFQTGYSTCLTKQKLHQSCELDIYSFGDD